MFQADMPLLATHAARADSIHLMNYGNSGSAGIGNVVEVDIKIGSAVVVVIEAMVTGSDCVYFGPTLASMPKLLTTTTIYLSSRY
jgi:hypothetical protein